LVNDSGSMRRKKEKIMNGSMKPNQRKTKKEKKKTMRRRMTVI